jgi:DNA polymerase-3 subunit delta'
MAWDDVLGHELAKRIWQSHLSTGRVANAYLLAGPEGIGKCRLAFEMAKALNCVGTGARPCDACSMCRSINRRAHPDVHYLAPEGASGEIRIDAVRSLIGRVALRPFNATRQVAIFDRIDRLTEEAANSVLKVLEEPPGATTFLLLTAHVPRCMLTILSRCQLIRCRPLSTDALTQLLAQRTEDDSRAQMIARRSGGSAARALALAEHWKDAHALQAHVAHTSAERWLERPLPETRQDVGEWIDALLQWLRDVTFVAVGEATRVVHQESTDALREQARDIDVDRCVETAFEFLQLRESLDHFANPRLVAALVRERWLNLHTGLPR